MASNLKKASSLVPDSPAVKRQKTASGYNNTGGTYDSDADSGDELLADYIIPDTPAQDRYETQPTQIIDRSAPVPSSPLDAAKNIVQVPASSPLQSRDVEASKPAVEKPKQDAAASPVKNLASSIAPAGTIFKPPYKMKPPPTRTYINLDDDDGPTFQGGSSDVEDDSVNIRPSTFVPRSALGSSGASPIARPVNGNTKFQSILANAAYKPPEKGKPFADSMSMGGSIKKPQTQMKPERARPVEDIPLSSLDQQTQDKVKRLKTVFPNITVLHAYNTLMTSKGSVDDAVGLLSDQAEATVISDDEIGGSQSAKKQEPQMKRGLNAPINSIKDRYSSTQSSQKPTATATPPPKPKKRLIQGRRNPSSPEITAVSSPAKSESQPEPVLIDDFDTDSGVASASDEDPELSVQVLKYLNTCKVEELVELTNTTKANAEAMVAARPFKNLDAARNVANPTTLKSGKKSTKAPIGDKIVDTAMDMFSGYEAIDALVAKCEKLGKPLAEEMSRWGFDVYGAAKDGELEMTSFDTEFSSPRDSGVGSPSDAAASQNDDAGDDDLKLVGSKRKRGHVNFLKKPEIMADDCILKDYQVVGLNWLALMYRRELSCILADEMGLGKTCQVISLLSHLVETGNRGPHLVICPGSTLENWLREFPKFSPKLAVEPYYGVFPRDLQRLIPKLMNSRCPEGARRDG
jgi:SWI/SNF-related matrix-associated actin-dependent regulator 1 of chromatin subfamily A